MERERFDGADIAHLLRARADQLDWPRVLRRFGPYWRILLAHLILFGFIYPSHSHKVLDAVTDQLLQRLAADGNGAADTEGLCQGTLLSRLQYLGDIERWGYRDARVPPHGNMTDAEIRCWTSAVSEDEA
jgi:hypothetical protein